MRLHPILVALPVALVLAPPAHAQVLANGHVDYAARLVDGRLRSLIKDGTGSSPIWREPAAVTFSVADAARTTVPASTPFLGRPGDTVWVLPQVQRAGVLWAGWNTEELGSAQVDGPVAWRLDSVSGPGHVTLFQTGVFGEPDVLFSSADGLPDTRSVPLGTHAHGNWVFTREGAYRLTFTMSARLTGGATSEDTQTLAVQVGPPATQEPTATPTPPPGATPAPAPTAPPRTGTAPSAPTLRTLATSLRGRRLTLRLRLDRTSRVSVALRRNGKTSARTKARTLHAGTRTVRLSLDRRPKAGRHTVRVTATADGRSATRTRTLRVR